MEFEKVRDIIVETLGCDAEAVTLTASLADDLGYYLFYDAKGVGHLCDIGNTIASNIMNKKGTDREFTSLYDKWVPALISAVKEWTALQ